MNKIIVLAGSRIQFERYLDDNGLTDSEAVYGWCPDRILDTRASKVVVIGDFYQRNDAHQLEELANSRVIV